MCLTYIVEGCTDSSSVSFDQLANLEDGSCVYCGCMDTIADNYDPQANQEDLCLYYGCTDSYFDNYWWQANVDDGSCYRYGCMLDDYPNYDHIATNDDGSCSMEVEIGDTLQGGIVFYIDDSGQHGFVAAIEDLPGTYAWGCEGNYLGETSTQLGTGFDNTMQIVSVCNNQNSAAFSTLGYGVDHYIWYLPSFDELMLLYLAFADSKIGGFNSYSYWSSSEYNADNAHYFNFEYDSGGTLYKSFYQAGVRPIHSF